MPEAAALGVNSLPSMVLLVRFFGGRASEVLRNSRNDVLPEPCVPTIRMLFWREAIELVDYRHKQADALRIKKKKKKTYLKGVGSLRLRTLLGLLTELMALLA